MKKSELRKITDPFVKFKLMQRLGDIFLRIGEYIRRVNKEEEWKNFQETLSPINWGFEEIKSKKINSIANKIKVRIFHQQSNMWNAISSVCDEFVCDDKYDVLVVLTGSAYNLCSQVEQMKQLNLQYIVAQDYSFESDKPDILLIYNSWVWYSFPKHLWEARKYTKFIIEIPLWTRDNFGSIFTAHEILYWKEIKPDYCIVDQYMYKKYSEFDKFNKYKLFGHPKLDILYRRIKNKVEIPVFWKKLKEKKILVFVTDHGLTMNGVYQDCAFDIYVKNIFKFFIENEDYGLIFRPHDSYINDLLHSFWSYSDYQYLKKMIDNSSNIVWDDTDDFTLSYSIADAIISDLNCDLTASAFLINKPVAVLHRNDMETRAYSPEITDYYININSLEDLDKFFKEFELNNDTMKKLRNEKLKNTIYSFNGKNGKEIKEFIEKKFFETR